jgi:glycosyltransferase involved in cell wall biosynthesis
MKTSASKPVLALVLPIYNEEEQLAASVSELCAYAEKELQAYDWRVIVGDNASTDRSPQIYAELEKTNSRLGHVRLEQKGRGRMLKKIWAEEPFDVSLYMDVDLSTRLKHVRPCVDAIAFNGYDLASGSRLKRGAKVVGRSLKREITSRGYIYIIRALAWSHLSDYQCGFKAVSKEAALRLLPLVEDPAWFFDSELLLLAEKGGFKIYEEPVYWQDDPGTTVNVYTTARDDLRGLARVVRERPWKNLKER